MDAPQLHQALLRNQAAVFDRVRGPVARRCLDRLESWVHRSYRFPWRVAEAPAVVPRAVAEADRQEMRHLLAPYLDPSFAQLHQSWVPERYRRPDGEGWCPQFFATDFQRAFDDDAAGFTWGVPEVQSFPGNLLLKPLMLRAWLPEFPEISEESVLGPGGFEGYCQRLQPLVVGDAGSREAVIVELDPLGQKTFVDMLLFARFLGTPVVDLRDLEPDDQTGEIRFNRSFEWGSSGPVLVETPGVARRILCRALPEEMDDAISRGDLCERKLRATFQGALDRKTAGFVVHPQDFFVVHKATLVGNPHHRHPILPVAEGLFADLRNRGFRPEDGVVKPVFRAGARGLVGFGGAVTESLLRTLVDEQAQGGAPFVWQLRFPNMGFPDPDHAGSQLYHELRLMWASRDVDGKRALEPLTGMTRWSRPGRPANAGFQNDPWTGTHGILETDVELGA